MIRLKVGLKPKEVSSLSVNYKYRLRDICYNFIERSKKDRGLSFKQENEIIKKIEKAKSSLTFSELLCSDYEVNGKSIIFKDEVSWYINSHSYETILQLVQGFYEAGSIFIDKAEFEILSIEASEIKKLANELPSS